MQEKNKTWCPAIELNETDDNLILKAEVPGVGIHQIRVQAEAESISIVGVHNHPPSPAEKPIIPSQLHYGRLECTVPLPVKIQVNKVRAELVDGVLTVTMPKLKLASAVS